MTDMPPRPAESRISTDEADPAARAYWESAADTYQAEHGGFLGIDGVGFVWGPEGVTESTLQLLGDPADLPGMSILEVGCGAGQCGAWVARQGADVFGVDISVPQLRWARRLADPLPVAAGTAVALPFARGSFDIVFASYGAVPFVGDLLAMFAEVRRVLRPGGLWVYSTTHPIRWAFPDDPGIEGLTATNSYFDRSAYVERDHDGVPIYAEFHRTLGDHVAALVSTNFAIVGLIEPQWAVENTATWGGWSPLRGSRIPGTLIMRAVALG